jgi:glycosyltransferase involved in cell wall biosynthesis
MLKSSEEGVDREESMDRALVSIIINNYNYGRFLRDAIESALRQTYPLIEVIVVDDGSTDESRSIIEEYVRAGKVIPVLKQNGGQASAFNAGFAASRGDFILFLDADDVILPTCVEEALAAWREGATKVQWRMQVVNGKLQPEGRLMPGAQVAFPSGDFKNALLTWRDYPAAPTSGNLFARRFLMEVLPIPEHLWRIATDGYLNTMAGLMGHVISLDRNLSLYRIHGDNNWTTNVDDMEKLRIKALISKSQGELILRWAAKHGQVPKFPFGSPYLYKLGILLKINAPTYAQEAGFSESRAILAFKGLWAALTWPFLPWALRLRWALVLVPAGILPRRAANKFLIWSLYPSTRPPILKRLLEKLGWKGG